MLLSDLRFNFPEELIATSPSRPTRVMFVNADGTPQEISVADLIEQIPSGDTLILNDTKVLKRRVFAGDLEILFLEELPNGLQKVLFPSKKFNIGDEITLPNGSVMKLIEKGLPQIVEVAPKLTDVDFEKMGELPLPPYIQKARHERHNVQADESWYQTAWAQNPGSFAAPTASLHFSAGDLEKLAAKGVRVEKITLHVGLGTFLPVKVENLDQHKMHAELYDVASDVWQRILDTKRRGQKVWALGTTVTRTLETVARTENLSGASDLLLQVGSEFKIVDRLMTNFHQPESTLLALVAGFSSLDRVHKNYQWAIKRKFKLFSYGDLSVWLR